MTSKWLEEAKGRLKSARTRSYPTGVKSVSETYQAGILAALIAIAEGIERLDTSTEIELSIDEDASEEEIVEQIKGAVKKLSIEDLT